MSTPDDEPEVLRGGTANAGRVVRVGDEVRRPAPANAVTLHALARHVSGRGVAVPVPLGLDADGVERVRYLPGDVGLAPYPAWVGADTALRSVGRLLRRFHDATCDLVAPDGASWSAELADPAGGEVICHDDVCIENVVFDSGAAAGLLDLEFAAPGRRVWDVAHTARYWVPLTDPRLPGAVALGVTDPARRLRVLVDAYDLDADARASFVDVALTAEQIAAAFVERRAAAGDPAFVAAWDDAARRRFDAKLAWIEREADRLSAALALDGR